MNITYIMEKVKTQSMTDAEMDAFLLEACGGND